MSKKILKIRAETVNSKRSRWFITLSIKIAKRVSEEWNRTIYQIPNGAYVIRVPKGKDNPQRWKR